MPRTDADRINLALTRIQHGLRGQGITHQQTLALAERLSDQELIPLHTTDGRTVHVTKGTEFDPVNLDPTVNTLRRTRKITEILEDELNIDAGHGKFARAATTAGKLSSIGSLAISTNGLLTASQNLEEQYDEHGSLAEAPTQTYEDFFRSVCIVLIECFLFTTPINFQVAWRGTRYLNNQYLYHLRKVSLPLYRYVLSEVHYVIRGIGPKALRAVGQFSDYLISVSASTVAILWKNLEEISWRDIPDRVEETVTDFRKFVETEYDVTTPALGVSDLRTIYTKIFEEVKSMVDAEFPSIDTLVENTSIST